MRDREPDIGSERLREVIRAQTEIVRLGLDLSAVMTFVAERAQRITGAHGAVVELAEGEEMVYRAASGILQNHIGLRLQRSGSLTGLCVEKGFALRCEDSESDPRVDREACRRIGLRSMIVVPLRHDDAVAGVLKVVSEKTGAFDEMDIHLLELMSDLIAASMFHAAQYNADELYLRATHDALTGLPNRSVFFDRLRLSLAQARRERARFGILNLDMDELKPINDLHGHRAGDAAIREFAARLKQAARNTDTVARVGGDEFGIILWRIEDRDGAMTQARRLQHLLEEPFRFGTHSIPLQASIGVAVYPDDGEELDPLIDSADRSMYGMKRSRKGN